MHNISMVTFPSAPHHVRHPPQGHCEVAKVTLLLRTARLNSTDFFKIPKILLVLGFLFWRLWKTHPPHACVNTCAQVCTKLTHVLSRKVLSLTKPKGNIYKRNPSAIILHLHYASGSRYFLHQSAQPSWESIYIYIYILSSNIVSQLFSVARQVGRSKLRSKPAQLYLRLSIRPLG